MLQDAAKRQQRADVAIEEARRLQAETFRRRVAKTIDQTWATKGGVPCPHCDTVLLAQDFDGKMSWHNASIELERRELERAGSLHRPTA